MSKKKKIVVAVTAIIILGLGMIVRDSEKEKLTGPTIDKDSEQIIPKKKNKKENKSVEVNTNKTNYPIANASSRITKKPFGIMVSPGNSPVEPERFSGFHTGTDFEILPEELNEKVEVFAICDGKILQKSRISGYGGVIIQECSIDNSSATIIYGHLSINGDNVSVANRVQKEEEIAVLGNDKSSDTDGERKHLHLGIHKGKEINLKGYVDTKKELAQWIDVIKYLNEY